MLWVVAVSEKPASSIVKRKNARERGIYNGLEGK